MMGQNQKSFYKKQSNGKMYSLNVYYTYCLQNLYFPDGGEFWRKKKTSSSVAFENNLPPNFFARFGKNLTVNNWVKPKQHW